MMLLINKMKRLKLMIVQKPASNTIELIVIDLDNGEDQKDDTEIETNQIQYKHNAGQGRAKFRRRPNKRWKIRQCIDKENEETKEF